MVSPIAFLQCRLQCTSASIRSHEAVWWGNTFDDNDNVCFV